jgi:dual specificity tyrosine-phosphorylation-regulated kinase 2/3/4
VPAGTISSSGNAGQATAAVRRASSSSIGHSLLRGSMPLGAAEEFGERLEGGSEDAAAEALRKHDGVGTTPRSSRDAGARLRESSRSPRARSSAGRRTPSGTSASRTASPSGKPAANATPRQREDSSRGTAARTLRNGRAEGLSTDSPARGSQSPRARRSQLPPMPASDGAVAHDRRSSQASVTSNTSNATSTRSGRPRRMSDASQHSVADVAAAAQSAPRISSDDEPRTASGLPVPPVPPLPKGWEVSRASVSSESAPRPSNGSVAAAPPAPASVAATPSHPPVTAPRGGLTRKWSLSNISNALSRSPSVTFKSEAAKFDSPRLAAGSPTPDVRRPSIASVEPDSPAVASVASSDRLRTSDLLSSPSVSSPASGKNRAPPSPRVRRTPSFFGSKPKQSSEAASLSSLERERTHEDEKPAAVPASGRASRTRSILGFGNLLRSSASRKSVPAAVQAPFPSDADSDALQRTKKDAGKQSSSPRMASFRDMRRTSLMSGSRKRGMVRVVPDLLSTGSPSRAQTLPAAADAHTAQDATLPPMQVAPLPDSPKRATLEASNGNVDLPASRRRLSNSSSATELGRRKVASVTTTAAAPLLPAIAPSPSISLAGVNGDTSPSKLPASRIPRALPLNKSTPARSATVSAAGSHTRRLSGTGPTSTGMAPSMSASKTTSSLASSFGIASDDESAVTETPASSLPVRRVSMSSAKVSDVAAAAGSSSTLVAILNAYAAAKTPTELEGVLRRARIASTSSSLSPSEREVLVSLVARQEQRTKAADGTATTTPRAKLSEGAARTPRTFTSSVSSASFAPAEQTPAPRKVRASLTAASAIARSAREAALSQRITPRTSVASRQSPALSETTQRTSSAASRTSATSPVVADEEERLGDEEMEAYIKRQHAKKVAAGASLEELEKMLNFPEPEPPGRAYSPRQAEAMFGDKLSAYELQEMQEFKEIYFCGTNPAKKPAAPGKPDNNFGYDDERGDYLVVNHDHLAYRYEIIDLLGRGSFGQVLQCKDHKTGRSVAIKLIRNKKRFHHQALVEVKILENLTKWVSAAGSALHAVAHPCRRTRTSSTTSSR